MIVGTAGHVDHGKTTLVRALTGVDTDRLPEEKARGMSIELGFAHLDLPEGGEERIGFIDVPGHERLLHTMLAGATGIDFALLLVAADDGVMPQTREHVAVLSLLGLQRGLVALTKTDRVEASRVDEVRGEVVALLAGTPLAGAPMLAVSAVSGDGVDALRQRIFDAARQSGPSIGGASAQAAASCRQPAFRMAVDRSFTLAGTGTVVTGTVRAGRLRVGDELRLAPSNVGSARMRVRSLHAHNREVGEASVGQRCAIGLAGGGRDDAARGRWLVAPDIVATTTRLDATVMLWPGESRPLRSGTPVHVHLGTGDCLGTLTVLQTLPERGMDAGACAEAAGAAGADMLREGLGHDTPRPIVASPADALAAGGRARVQLLLRQPVAVWRGDKIVLRDASASRTLGGGVVLDPFAPARYRRTDQRLAELDAWALSTPETRLAGLLDAAPNGVSLRRWAIAEGLDTAGAWPLPPGTLAASDPSTGDWALASRHRQALTTAALEALRTFHVREPALLGPDVGRLRRLTAPRLPDPLWRALLADLQRRGLLKVQGAHLHLPAHGLTLSASDERLAQKIAPLLAGAGFEGSWARDLARDTGQGEALMRSTLARLSQRGDLHQVVRDLCYPTPTVARLVAVARTIAAAGGGVVTAARFRDATELGRKRAIQILEYFDRIGVSRRVGDSHRLRPDSGHFPLLEG